MRYELVFLSCLPLFLHRIVHGLQSTKSLVVFPKLKPNRRVNTRSLRSSFNDIDTHIPIDTNYPGLKQVYHQPDIFVVDNFLTEAECDDIVSRAQLMDMSQSPVAYAGWSEDLKLITRLLPVVLLPIVYTLLNEGIPKWEIALVILGCVAVFSAASVQWTNTREAFLQGLRTSTSITFPGDGKGDEAFIAKSERLLRCSWQTFEAPTVICYQPGQLLAPHFDANQGADVEDRKRGGQTLATILAYLNDVRDDSGGRTIFGRLGLEYVPRKGSCLVFFPANSNGVFDERVEHEGAATMEDKWLTRIWKHQYRVPPPYGLPDAYRDEFQDMDLPAYEKTVDPSVAVANS